MYPRVAKNRAKANHLEMKLEIDMLRQFSGLAFSQRDALLRIIDKNARIRQKAGLTSGVFEKIQDDTYDHVFGSHGQLRKSNSSVSKSQHLATASESGDSLAPKLMISMADDNDGGDEDREGGIDRDQDRGYISDPGPIIKVSSDSWLDEDEFGEPYYSDDEISELTDDLADLEFPIEDYELKSKKQDADGEDEYEMDRYGVMDRMKRQASTANDQNLKLRYGHFIDVRKRGATAGQRAATKQDLEHEAMMEMKLVSSDLQKWVTEVLDNSINLDPDVLAEVNKLAEAAAERPKSTQQVQSGQQGQQHQKPTSKDLSVLERVDISGFDVLLNACKPSILEAKPPVRLNVVHEINPPDALVNTLQKNLGMNLEDKKGGDRDRRRDGKLLPEVDSSFTYRRKIRRQRPHYGAWYVPPQMWNDYMKNHGEDAEKKKAEESKHHRFGGIVQQKLDEINRKREIDYDHFMKEIEQDSSTVPPASGSGGGGGNTAGTRANATGGSSGGAPGTTPANGMGGSTA
eukprot:jgi/Hompol1/1209/HPOL_000324-RA